MGRIPESPEAIHPAWLTRALSERYPGVRVVNVEVAERHEVTNAHARLRVRYDPPAGAPEWLFCKMLPTVESRRRAIAQMGMGVREAQFYERLAPRFAMRVPNVHLARCDERDGSCVLLLEDLLHSCRISDGTVGLGVGAAAAALEDLADLHLRYADAERRSAEAGWVPPPLYDPSYGTALRAARPRAAQSPPPAPRRVRSDRDALRRARRRAARGLGAGPDHGDPRRPAPRQSYIPCSANPCRLATMNSERG